MAARGLLAPGAGQCISAPARGGGAVGSTSGGWGGGGAVCFGRFNERGGGGGGGGVLSAYDCVWEKKYFWTKGGGCKLQPPTNPPLHFLESIAFLATNLLCDNDCGYDNYVST